jgi:mono/diheme cytochrome c family protein
MKQSPGFRLACPSVGYALLGLVWITFTPPASAEGVDVPEPPPLQTPEQLFNNTCSACHGLDGTGALHQSTAFEEEVPDFSDCTFASREPDADWFGIAHDGGPTRGFSEMMPAFGDARSEEELLLILEHIRTFCDNKKWPAGRHNLPKALNTEKAFPEDEAYVRFGVGVKDPVALDSKIVIEKRIGPMGQFEFVLPWGIHRGALDDNGDRDPTHFGVGDIAIGYKQTLAHNKKSGTIVAIAAEIKLPTGNEEWGFGKGTAAAEPFVAFAQEFPYVGFVQVMAGGEIPFLTRKAKPEVFWRVVYGRSFQQPHFGRTWSPMVELLGAGELEDGEFVTKWDLVPQVQITLNRRQHVMVNVGCKIPLDHIEDRQVTVMMYLLWDWFDGGFFQGW